MNKRTYLVTKDRKNNVNTLELQQLLLELMVFMFFWNQFSSFEHQTNVDMFKVIK